MACARAAVQERCDGQIRQVRLIRLWRRRHRVTQSLNLKLSQKRVSRPPSGGETRFWEYHRLLRFEQRSEHAATLAAAIVEHRRAMPIVWVLSRVHRMPSRTL